MSNKIRHKYDENFKTNGAVNKVDLEIRKGQKVLTQINVEIGLWVNQISE